MCTKTDFEYISIIKDDNDLCIPYLLLLRTKDYVLIPYLVKAIWKCDNYPKILLNK